MGRFCLRAHAAAGVLVSLSGASAQPCATGSWPALFPAPPLLEVSAVNRVVELDPDDSGPLPRGLLVMGATLYGSAWSRPHPNPLQSVQFWDGWELLPLATDHPVVARQGDAVRAALVFDDDAQGPNPGVLYAVGGLLRPSSAPVARLVNGRWEPVPGVRGNAVDALVFDEDGAGPAVPAMFVVGTAGRTEDVLDAGVLRWDGASWSVPGDSFGPAEITDAVVADPDGPGPLPECLVVCGFIPMTGEAPQWRVAAWDGQTWRALGAPMNASVLALHAFDADGAGPQPSRLFAAGVFSGSGGAGTSRVARFDGNSWVSTGAIFSPGAVKSLGSFDRDADGPLPAELYLGGDHIAGVRRWDGGASWTRIDGPGATSVDQIIGVDPDGDGPRPTSLALVGKIGLFQFEPDAPIGAGAIFWDGASWSDLDRGLDATVNDAIVFDPDLDGPEPSTLIIGGEFRTVGGLRANRVAAWDPARGWRALDQGLAGVVHAFALADLDDAGPNPPRLVAAGNLAFPGAGPGNFVAEWDGQSWSPLGLPFDGPIYSIISGAGENAESVGAELLVGGGFLQVGDTTVGRVARWDGVAWGAVGEGIGLTDSVGFDFDLAVGPAGVLGRSHPRILAASPPGLSFPGAGACAFASFGGDWSPVDPAGQICALTAPDDLGVHIVPAPADEQPADTLYFAREQSLSDFSPPWIGRIRGGVLEPLALPPGSVESALPTISALGFFDEDAEGPAPPALIAGVQDRALAGVPTVYRLDADDQWSPLGAPAALSLPSAFVSFDLDADGPEPPTLIVAEGVPSLIIRFSTTGGTFNLLRPGLLRAWTPAYAPRILEQPAADLFVAAGSPAEFVARVMGAGAHLQWRRDGEPIDGACSQLLRIDAATGADRGVYDLVIMNACGSASTTPVTLRVRAFQGDANADSVTDFDDITDVLERWGSDYSGATGPGDADSNGVVDLDDITAILSNWGLRDDG